MNAFAAAMGNWRLIASGPGADSTTFFTECLRPSQPELFWNHSDWAQSGRQI